MKKSVFLNYALSHLFTMALGGAATVAMTALRPTAVSPLWCLMTPVMALAAYAIARRLRAETAMDTKLCWDAAMYLYLTELALLALLWKMSEVKAVVGVNVWNLSCAPVLVGLDAWIGHIHTALTERGYTLLYRTENYKNLILPLMGVFAAAIEPLCLTLGFIHKNAAKETAPSAGDGSETSKEEE